MRVFSQINNCQQKQNKKTKQKTKAKNRQNKKGAPLLGLATDEDLYIIIKSECIADVWSGMSALRRWEIFRNTR